MTIAFKCGGCGRAFKAPDEAAGKTITCKECSQTIRVPRAAAPAARPHAAPPAGPRKLPPRVDPDLEEDEEELAPAPPPKPPRTVLARTRYQASKEERTANRRADRKASMSKFFSHPTTQLALWAAGILVVLIGLNFALEWHLEANPKSYYVVGGTMSAIGFLWGLGILAEDDGYMTGRLWLVVIQLLFRLDRSWMALLLLFGGFFVIFIGLDMSEHPGRF